ncbi:MAG: Nitrogen permease regulator 3 [Piccolia ochrophora]|nr:MAG: Nitrogen permease regulator 3 [Piccolia ochrophora]
MSYESSSDEEEGYGDQDDWPYDDKFVKRGPPIGLSDEENTPAGTGRGHEKDGDISSHANPRSDAAPWGRVCGFTTSGLVSMLVPHKAFNKKKFELGIEPLTYLSYPVFRREDGVWKKKKAKTKSKATKTDPRGDTDHANSFTSPAEAAKDASSTPLKDGIRKVSLEDKPTAAKDDGLDDDSDSKSTATEDDLGAMSMFNVVFVMNPPVLEHHHRVAEMYEHVVKKFAKAVKYEQARTNWVWKESEVILNLKERAKEDGTPMSSLWSTILAKSTLAKALSEVFVSISTSKIAHVFIGDTYDLSLQIPQIDSISRLPTMKEHHMPGLWLTTAHCFDKDEEIDDVELSKHFGLLLLEDVDAIIKDIDTENGPPRLSQPLVDFVRIVKPTLSFSQLATQHNLSLHHVQVLSRHLIHWRRARAIPPLNRSDQYIVSPNCDMTTLPTARVEYAARFPSLPPLHKMLAMLSGSPRAYSTLIPSKDHRAAYMDILAWLMKGGWVTQLRTFVWVMVPARIKKQVADEMAAEKAHGDDDDDDDDEYTEDRHADRLHKTASSPIRPSSPGPPSYPATHPIPTPTYTHHPIDSGPPTILLEPHKANHVESRWLDAIGASLGRRGGEEAGDKPAPDAGANDAAELRAAWHKYVRYFNGKHAMEKVPVREGVKRKVVWRWLVGMEREGVLVVVRHW